MELSAEEPVKELPCECATLFVEALGGGVLFISSSERRLAGHVQVRQPPRIIYYSEKPLTFAGR